MYANLRQYRVSPEDLEATAHLVDTELADRLSAEPGFVAYELMAQEDGSVCSMTIFSDQAGADRSQEIAAEFVRDQLSGIEIERTGSMMGEIMVSRAREMVLEAAHR